MSTFPRRSPRFQQRQEGQTSANTSYDSSRTSSTVSTSHPSPSAEDLNLSTNQDLFGQASHFLGVPGNFDAPLPSPSATDIDPFASRFQYNMGGQNQNQNPNNVNATSCQNNTNQSQNSQSQQQAQQQYHHNSFSQPQRPNYPPTSVNGVPPGLPADFLAEAAKRAQMACLMRDLGDVAL